MSQQRRMVEITKNYFEMLSNLEALSLLVLYLVYKSLSMNGR